MRTPAADDGTHFVTLVKPEVLRTDTAVDAMAEVVRVLEAADVAILRCALMPAKEFGELGFLLRHYPRLHRIATDGPSGLCSDAKRELVSLLARSEASFAVGAFQAGAYDTILSATTLEARCREAGIHKLGSGSYASVIELNGVPIAVLNGFVPALTSSYLDPTALVGLIECHSYREIADLRADVLGALNPDAAKVNSLRGALGALGRKYGVDLSEGRNGVHLSAGHLEGMFQCWQYFAAADGHGLESTALGRSLDDRGTPMAAVAALADDRNLREDSEKTVAPFGATEDLSRDAVVDRVRRWTADGRGTDT
ncbi:hypothetical protein [Nocardia sp. NPDC057455]|uniref:hypothetical protein n=1 Tax=Nocardia sp. NPDC057455 TaxID=3346138 RepID=UPI00366E909F